MASIHALTAHLVPGRTNAGAAGTGSKSPDLRITASTRAAAQETYYIEDGWVFREHHGKYVECICRTEEIPAVPALRHSEIQQR